MAVLPPLVSFCVRVGPGDPYVPASLAATGTPVVLRGEVGGVVLEGAGVAPAAAPGPAVVSDGDLAVVLAGEIYHRDGLAGDLGSGAGCQDAEFLLACFRRYGSAVFRLLNGRFAVLVVSGDRVVLATDHAASVPLYVRAGERQVWVSTEAKALVGQGAPDVGATTLAGGQPVLGAPGLHRVRAGTVMTAEIRSPGVVTAIRAARTWAPPLGRSVVEPSRAVAAVAERLGAAVDARLAGGPVTVVLSGGIDSGSVAALATRTQPVESVTLGTDAGDEFGTARVVAQHAGTSHTEVAMSASDLVRELPYAVAAAEIADPDVLEYLLPLVALYRRLPGPPRRILTGYGADIPLGGMHRARSSLEQLDAAIAEDMATFDGLNELTPLLSGVAGHWSTHPYWDRDVLDLLTGLEPGLKRREGLDKWALRAAMRGALPEAVRTRPKLGIHEGSGLTSTWSRLLQEAGVAPGDVPAAKRDIARQVYDAVVLGGVPTAEVDVHQVMSRVAA